MVVIATGSSVSPLDIPGGNQENVYSVYDVIEGKATVGNRVLIIDENGHYKAAGVAELLASQGATCKCSNAFKLCWRKFRT